MPLKLGNGGHSQENYDPKTGKYVESENSSSNEDNRESFPLKESSEKITFDDIIKKKKQELSNNNNVNKPEEKPVVPEKKELPPIETMGMYDLQKEINDNLRFFRQQGIIIHEMAGHPFFNGDLKLACANWRQLRRLIETFPVDLNGCKFVNSTRYQEGTGNWAYMQGEYPYSARLYEYLEATWKVEYKPNAKMNFNVKKFRSYEQNTMDTKRNSESGWWVQCDDSMYCVQSLTHEFGHALHNQIFGDYLRSQNSDGKIMAIITKDSGSNGMKKQKKEFVEGLRKEIYEIYNEKRGIFKDEISYYGFITKISDYGKKNVLEWWAETFSNMMCGKPTLEAEAMKEYLKRKGYMRGE